MGIGKRIAVLAAALFIFTYTAHIAFADDLPSTTITITKNQVQSGSPHTVSTFRPSVDLGIIGGVTQGTLNKYMDSLCGISQGSSRGVMGPANQFASSVIGAVTPPTIGASSQNKPGPTSMTGPGQSATSLQLTPAQVVSMQQQGAVVISVSPPPSGAQTLNISAPATGVTTPAQTTVTGSTPTIILHDSTSPNSVLLPTGTTQYQVANQSNQMSISQSVQQQNTSLYSGTPYVSGWTFSLPVAIVLDTFWAPKPNAVTKAKLKVSWNISQLELNEFNRMRAMGTCVSFSSMGSVSMKTEKFEFRREVGARADIGLSVQWEGSLRKLASVQLTDIAMEINDPSSKNNNVNDPLSAQYLRHSDSVFVSDVAEKIIAAIGGKADVAGKVAGDTSLGRKILGKIIGQLGVKVQVVQSTLNRKVVASFKATGKDFLGKVIPLEVTSNPITFLSDNHNYPLNITFPNDCPPLKEITLKPIDATYSFDEHGYPELVVTGFGQELPTGPLLERAELFTEASHTMTDWTASGGDMKIAVTQKPVIYPFRGNIAVGNPPGGLPSAQVRIFTRSASGHESVFSTADSNPAGDFVADICLFVTGNAQPTPPPYIIEVSKAGYQTITTTGNPERFIKTKDNPLTYQINMPLATNQALAVSGKILDNTNQGVPGAEVLLSCAGVEYQAVSDASGAYQFPAVLSGSTIQLHANKTGLYFNPESRNVSSGTKTITVDLKSSIDRVWGRAKFNFSAESGSLPASVNVLRSSSGRSFSFNIPTDGVAVLSVLGSNRETFTFSKDDYTITPGSVTVELSEDVAVREFNIAVSSRIPSAATLSADKASIERFGSFYNPAGENEKAVLTTKVVDSAGRPVGGTDVRFEISGTAVKILKEGTRPSGARPNAAYAQTDSAGNAQATICSMRDLGAADITAAVYYGDVVSNMRSNGYALTIVENTRPERAGKPTCSMTAEVGNLGLSGPGVRIAKGGDILFRLNQSTNSQLGTLTGYKFLYSKDNGPAEEELFNTSPHPVARKTFNEAGSYNVQYMVKRTFDGTDTWSDPAQAIFTVAAYEPPRATLTLPRATGTVNLPLDYSFIGEVSAPFKQMLITFGDNQGNIDLDAGLLSGKYYWSGTFYHTYTREGTFQIKLKVIDQSNAFKEEIKQVTIGSVASLNDHTPPTGSISINNGAASTTGKGVLIRAAATDDISGVYRMRYSNDGSNWSSWNSVAIDDRPYPSIVKDRAWELTDGAGTKTVYVQFKDAADNVSQTITDTIELQAAGLQVSGALPLPQVTITGYQGAPMPRGSIAITSRSGNNISVTFSATNDWAIPVNQMALSFNNQSWAGWMPFEANKQISLDGHLDATKIYVIFADGAGGQSPAYSVDIPAAPAAPQAAASAPIEAQAQDAVADAGVGAGQAVVEVQEQLGGGQVGGGEVVTEVQERVSGGSPRDRIVDEKKEAGDREEVPDRARGERVTDVRQLGRDSRLGDMAAKRGGVTTAADAGQGAVVETATQGPVVSTGTVPTVGGGTPPGADLLINELKVPTEIFAGSRVELEVVASNDSKTAMKNAVITCSSEDGLKESRTVSMRGRDKEHARFAWTPQREGRQQLTARVESAGDPNTANNTIVKSVEVRARAQVNLALSDARIPPGLIVGKRCDLEVTVSNESQQDIRDCKAIITTDDGYRDEEKVQLGPKARERVRFAWTPKAEGRQNVSFSLEYNGDSDPSDNQLVERVDVRRQRSADEVRPGGATGDIGEKTRDREKRDIEGRASGIIDERELERK